MIGPAPLHAEIARGPDGGGAWWLRTSDGVRIRLGVWARPEAKGTVFLLPGRTEYIEKYGPAAAAFAARGYAMLAVDWRGQGLADRLCEDPMQGHVQNFDEYQRDFDAVLAAATELDLPRPWVVLGHSMGGAIGLRRLSAEHPFAACAFSAPMWAIGLPAPLQPFGTKIARWLQNSKIAALYPPGFGRDSYVWSAPFKGNKLTTDAGMWAFMLTHLQAVPGIALAGPSFQWVAEGLLECAALETMPSPDLPCYCALGGNERIVATRWVHARMKRWPKGRLEVYEGAEHELMMETPARQARFYDACAALFDAAPR